VVKQVYNLRAACYDSGGVTSFQEFIGSSGTGIRIPEKKRRSAVRLTSPRPQFSVLRGGNDAKSMHAVIDDGSNGAGYGLFDRRFPDGSLEP
jgi:hypothetical protein